MKSIIGQTRVEEPDKKQGVYLECDWLMNGICYFTTIGLSPHAVFNAIWAAYLEHDWHSLEVTMFRLHPSSHIQVNNESWNPYETQEFSDRRRSTL